MYSTSFKFLILSVPPYPPVYSLCLHLGCVCMCWYVCLFIYSYICVRICVYIYCTKELVTHTLIHFKDTYWTLNPELLTCRYKVKQIRWLALRRNIWVVIYGAMFWHLGNIYISWTLQMVAYVHIYVRFRSVSWWIYHCCVQRVPENTSINLSLSKVPLVNWTHIPKN